MIVRGKGETPSGENRTQTLRGWVLLIIKYYAMGKDKVLFQEEGDRWVHYTNSQAQVGEKKY